MEDLRPARLRQPGADRRLLQGSVRVHHGKAPQGGADQRQRQADAHGGRLNRDQHVVRDHRRRCVRARQAGSIPQASQSDHLRRLRDGRRLLRLCLGGIGQRHVPVPRAADANAVRRLRPVRGPNRHRPRVLVNAERAEAAQLRAQVPHRDQALRGRRQAPARQVRGEPEGHGVPQRRHGGLREERRAREMDILWRRREDRAQRACPPLPEPAPRGRSDARLSVRARGAAQGEERRHGS